MHRNILSISRYYNVPYYRFNVYRGLENVEMDECTTKVRRPDWDPNYNHGLPEHTNQYIHDVTENYLGGRNNEGAVDGESENYVSEDLAAVAQILVDYKMARDGLQAAAAQAQITTHTETANSLTSAQTVQRPATLS